MPKVKIRGGKASSNIGFGNIVSAFSDTRRNARNAKFRRTQKRLGEKLLAIRGHFDCSLAQMAERLSNDEFSVRSTDISKYEMGDNEPPLPVLLRYARLAGITIEVLVDDKMDLPNSLK